ncbi:MAG: peptidase M16 [Cytophagaceae bacterium]|nr:peptidase M16 [Cytophagaceae bacterium]
MNFNHTLCCAFLLMMVGLKSTGQTIDYTKPLPIDTSYNKGVLPNGMTYYIKHTDVVKNAASYYIIQNVGSILENDDQQGLAHFLEHMAFNGTENFPGKGVLNTLQKHGAIFGKDINAYTSFDETVYNMNNIPVKDGLIDTCLTVLKDWSNYLLLTDEEIDAERGVIKEEWRTRQSGSSRLFDKSMPVIYNNSQYAKRLPIGKMDIVENFDYNTLRDFYHDWYRTDLQAIVVIGDIEPEEVENKIKDMFSSIPAVEHPKKRFVVDIPVNDTPEISYNLGLDPEVSTSTIQMGIRHNNVHPENTVGDLKKSLMEDMVTKMLSTRIGEKSEDPESNFLFGGVSYGNLSRTSNAFNIYVTPKINKQRDAFAEVLTEVVRAVKFGFVQPELDRAISEINNTYENSIAKKNDQPHRYIEYKIQQDFLQHNVVTDVEKEYDLAKKILSTITLDNLHNTIQNMYIKNNRFINVTGVEGQENLSKEDAVKIINDIEDGKSLTPYTDNLEGKNLISNMDINAGKILKTDINEQVSATTYTLSNGLKVHYRFVDEQKDNVSLLAISKGGMSLVADEDVPSARLISDMMYLSGIGNYSSSELKKLLSGKTARVSSSLGDINETISGSSSTKDVETMLQLMYVHFLKPRFDQDAFSILKNNVDNYILRKSKNIGARMQDSLTATVYGKNNPRNRIFDNTFASEVNLNTMQSVYKSRFENPADFDFYIVGDLKDEALKPLLEKYVASLPTNGPTENYKKNQAKWITAHIDEDIYIDMENPKSSVNIQYKKELPYSPANSLYTDALGDIMQLRITETVRESEGGAYSPRAGAYLSREPLSEITFYASFDCNPDLADKLAEIVENELKKIANGEIKEDDLDKTRTNFLKEREQAKDENAYYMSLISTYFRYDENIEDPKNFVEIVNSMSKDDIQDIARQILSDSRSYQVIFKPESKN